ncbi:MAG: DUF1801 domain-containing protein [Flavobacteriales bacterium]|jgi:hypothetical protein|nr:DUF1801 domain-containing protein [Flavobacteriales bacterium]
MAPDKRIADWYQHLPDPWQEVATVLRELILDASPLMREEWKYRTPFFTYRRWMCYLSLQQRGLVLGFVQGSRMNEAASLFAPTGHRLIRHYCPPQDPRHLPLAALRSMVAEAMAINDEISVRRGRKRS